MNVGKEKYVPQRNITPNFIRFKRKLTLTQARAAAASPAPPSRPTRSTPASPTAVPPRPVAAASRSTKSASWTWANSVLVSSCRGQPQPQEKGRRETSRFSAEAHRRPRQHQASSLQLEGRPRTIKRSLTNSAYQRYFPVSEEKFGRIRHQSQAAQPRQILQSETHWRVSR